MLEEGITTPKDIIDIRIYDSYVPKSPTLQTLSETEGPNRRKWLLWNLLMNVELRIPPKWLRTVLRKTVPKT